MGSQTFLHINTLCDKCFACKHIKVHYIWHTSEQLVNNYIINNDNNSTFYWNDLILDKCYMYYYLLHIPIIYHCLFVFIFYNTINFLL